MRRLIIILCVHARYLCNVKLGENDILHVDPSYPRPRKMQLLVFSLKAYNSQKKLSSRQQVAHLHHTVSLNGPYELLYQIRYLQEAQLSQRGRAQRSVSL